MKFHPEVLTLLQKRVLKQTGPVVAERQFYLGGGTALAIYFGHRQSVDLDWFTGEGIKDPLRLAQNLRDEGIPFVTGQIDRGTLYGTVSGVRVSFLDYRYKLLKPLLRCSKGGDLIASLDDLACMKLSALTQRGAKKDFVDIYALGIESFPLMEMVRLYQEKYSVDDIAHVLYSLTYFDDADRERMPKLFWDMDWRMIKKTIRGWVKKLG